MSLNSSQKTNKDLTNRILFTIFALVICRFGSFIPIAGIDSIALNSIAEQNQSGILGMFNMLSGGSLGRMSIFALAVMPYITASIIKQRPPEPYKGKGIKRKGQYVQRKEGKKN